LLFILRAESARISVSKETLGKHVIERKQQQQEKVLRRRLVLVTIHYALPK